MIRPRKPLLGIRTKPRHEIEAERLKSLAEKHRNRQREEVE